MGSEQRILIADDHEMVREALGSYIQSIQGAEVFTVGTIDEALSIISRLGPFDLTLLDFSMPGMNGYEGLKLMLHINQDRPVAIISGLDPFGGAERALKEGAAGYLPKAMPAKSLLNAINFMLSGERFAPLDMMLKRGEENNASSVASNLTARELQVLRELCAGQTNKEIARNMDLSEPTIKLHVKVILRKLGARNRNHAAMIARDSCLY